MFFNRNILPAQAALFFGLVFLLAACGKNSPASNATSTPTPASKEYVEYYGTGEVARRVMEVNGKKEGKMTDYFPDGRVKAERWFQNGQQTGRTLIFFPDGQIQETQYYAFGKKQGGDTVWYQNGHTHFTFEYKDEKKNGYIRRWTPDGKMEYEARYEMDTLVEVNGKNVRAAARHENTVMPRHQ